MKLGYLVGGVSTRTIGSSRDACAFHLFSKAQFKRRISHVPNLIAILGLVQTSNFTCAEFNCYFSRLK